MFRCLTLALALSMPALAAEARDLTGAMSYRERIALPPGAELLLELRGPEGIVAEATIGTEGRQVPLPFLIVAPPGGDYRLRGAIFSGGRAEWLSGEVVVPAGEEPLDLGVIPLTRHTAAGLASRMRCGAAEIEVGFVGDDVVLRTGAETIQLKAVAAASGAKFSNGGLPETVFWSKGNVAQVTLRGEALEECRPMIDTPLLPLLARGNEPFWRLELTEAGYVFEPNIGEPRQEGPLAAPVAVAEGLRFDLSPVLGVTVERRLCRDTMAGMPHPLSVTVRSGERELAGCGGAPASLLEGGWRVEHVEGAILPEGSEVTMAFDTATSRVSGKSACNRFMGSYTLTGEGLSFGPAAGTMMACPADLMAVERTFLDRLETVDRFDFAADGALELYAGGVPVVRARR
jgi:heat shock protein HslJ/membrane-bound inhibitor of C-type lysozyme